MNQPKYIAIVDDHSMFRKGLGMLIDLFPNYKVTLSATGGSDLIRQLKRSGPPDVLLMDIAMPEMDGYTLCAWVTANYPSIRTLALSTMDSEAAIIRMITAGARGYLHKDAEPGELKLAFEAVLTHGYYFHDETAGRLFPRAALSPKVGAAGIPGPFTKDELTFLKLACSELSYEEIAGAMSITPRMADAYRDALFRRLRVISRTGLALMAVRYGLVLL